ncbi:sulfite exporter TauE/SafE family protein [Methylocella silvestris]|uniref:Probable membrane transporter protein n=1 Tax=Methylocella silvestris TaxID=199596 RepID=A0A2J7TC75_METSI|nr:sulfite exporter TauE/SafE family protein [Methylocella silvestris]PNG24360.1 hypothetical protein CR492_19215 [Methylocella silvestris]
MLSPDALYGLGVGLVLSLTGGGGVLAVPALVLGLGYDLREAAPVAMIAVGAAASLGCLDGLRRRLVRYRAAFVMAAAGALCAPLGLKLAGVLPGGLLLTMFSSALLYTVIRMARQALVKDVTRATIDAPRHCGLDPATGRFVWTPRCFASMSAVGGLSGLASGLLGVGGGFIIVPGVQQFSDLEMHGSVATSLMVIALVSVSTVGGYIAAGGSLTHGASTFIAAVVVGMIGGRAVAPRVPAAHLKFGFAVTAGAAAIGLMAKAFAPLLFLH